MVQRPPVQALMQKGAPRSNSRWQGLLRPRRS